MEGEVGVTGFEPATLWSQTRCATKLRYTPKKFIYNVSPHIRGETLALR